MEHAKFGKAYELLSTLGTRPITTIMATKNGSMIVLLGREHEVYLIRICAWLLEMVSCV